MIRSCGQLRWYAYILFLDYLLVHSAPQILGVQALHRMRILHRDIKPANIFITANKHIIIGDYGLAQAWLDPFYADFPSTSLKARDAPGTMSYLAPEVVRGFYLDPVNVEVRKFATYSFEADIWSLGVTICDSWSRRAGLFHLQEGEDHLNFKSAIPSRILQMDVEPVVKQFVDEHPIWHLITRVSVFPLSWMDGSSDLWCTDARQEPNDSHRVQRDPRSPHFRPSGLEQGRQSPVFP